ncbi:MAG: hypothetical protein AABY86_06950, partial [Bdellovibrionota bacterium]
ADLGMVLKSAIRCPVGVAWAAEKQQRKAKKKETGIATVTFFIDLTSSFHLIADCSRLSKGGRSFAPIDLGINKYEEDPFMCLKNSQCLLHETSKTQVFTDGMKAAWQKETHDV